MEQNVCLRKNIYDVFLYAPTGRARSRHTVKLSETLQKRSSTVSIRIPPRLSIFNHARNSFPVFQFVLEAELRKQIYDADAVCAWFLGSIDDLFPFTFPSPINKMRY